METFSALLALCEGNSPVTGEFPAQRPVTRSFDVSFDLRPNKRLSKQSWGGWFDTPSRSLWRHCNENSTRTAVVHPSPITYDAGQVQHWFSSNCITWLLGVHPTWQLKNIFEVLHTISIDLRFRLIQLHVRWHVNILPTHINQWPSHVMDACQNCVMVDAMAWHRLHYDDVIMGVVASQITSLTIVYSGADQSKHQSSASLAFVWGIHRSNAENVSIWWRHHGNQTKIY